MKTSADTRNIGQILKAVREHSLIPKPHFQRRAVWTSRDKIALIRTIQDGYPFPEIYVAAGAINTESGDTTELLVDGQQRVRTLDEYFRGVGPFKTDRYITSYGKLNESEKKQFLGYDVAIRNLGMISDDKIREAFKRMNSTSYDLNDMERYNAVYLGEFKKFSEATANLQAFSQWRVFSANDIRRMKDVAYAASLVATLMSNYFHRDDEIESYLENYDEEFPRKGEMAARVMTTLQYIAELALPRTLRAWRKSDFYILFVEIDRQLAREKRRPKVAKTKASLIKHYEAVAASRKNVTPNDPEVRRYFEATLQNVNDRGQRIARGEVIKGLLDGIEAEPFEIDLSLGKPILDVMEDASASSSDDEEDEVADDVSDGSDPT